MPMTVKGSIAMEAVTDALEVGFCKLSSNLVKLVRLVFEPSSGNFEPLRFPAMSSKQKNRNAIEIEVG